MPLSGAVEVWFADLNGVPESLLAVLSRHERERASRLLDDRVRSRWSSSRAVLRDLLGRATGEDPVTLQLELGPYGKPELRRFSNDALHFNLSHSGSLALYALSFDREVGIDIEVADRRRSTARDEVAIARRMLGAEVAARLAQMDADRRHREFLAAWVAHEAIGKCIGHGLNDPPAPPTGVEPHPVCWVTPLEVGEGAFAALAVQGAEAAVRMQRWRPA